MYRPNPAKRIFVIGSIESSGLKKSFYFYHNFFMKFITSNFYNPHHDKVYIRYLLKCRRAQTKNEERKILLMNGIGIDTDNFLRHFF